MTNTFSTQRWPNRPLYLLQLTRYLCQPTLSLDNFWLIFVNYSVNHLSRKTMWMIIGAIIIVGGGFVFAEYRNVIPAQTEYTAPAVSAYSVNATSTAIADNDWQKVLVETTPATAKQKSLGGGTTSTQSQPLTETEKLGQSVISDYLQLKQSGGSASTSTINAIISHALNNSSIVTTAKVYDFSNIKIGKDDSKYADSLYGKGLVTILSKNTLVGDAAVYARACV